MSVLIKEREREWDERSYASSPPSHSGTKTIRRYRVTRPVEEEKEQVTIYKEREPERRTRRYTIDLDHDDPPVERRYEVDFERDREPGRRRYELDFLKEPERPEHNRELIIRREREPDFHRSDPELSRYDIDIRRERERTPERIERRYEVEYDRPHRSPFELERFSRSTEYFARPEPPQPIIIRQEPQPIIIQEAPRAPIVIPAREPEPQYIYQREERRDERREERPIPRPREREREEEYYYERDVRIRGDRRSREDDDRHEEDYYYDRDGRRGNELVAAGSGAAAGALASQALRPRDSASQYGREDREDREWRDDRSYSDDDVVVIRRKEEEEGYGRSRSPHHRRHLAEGALAGLGAAEILRNHKKKQGEDPGHRGRRDIAGAALGVVGAEIISRLRGRSRGRSNERGDGGRERSHSRVKTLAELGLGAAALAAAAKYASSSKSKSRGRSRSKSRRSSRHRSRSRYDSESEDDEQGSDSRNAEEKGPLNKNHRNQIIAGTGLATAAIAGLAQHARSKSRGGSRSRSRVREAVPVVAAGLGGAALAGLCEKYRENRSRSQLRKERKERESRSRERSAPEDETGLIQYGADPIYPTATPGDYYGNPASQRNSYYEDPAAAAAIPAVPPPATPYYPTNAPPGVPVDEPRRSRARHQTDASSLSSSSPEGYRRSSLRRHSGSRSRSRGLAEAGLAAGAAALGAHEWTKREERRKQRDREEEEHARYESAPEPPFNAAYTPEPPYTPSPAPNSGPGYPQGDNYYQQQQQYFPPPPPGPPPTGGYQNPMFDSSHYPPPPATAAQSMPDESAYRNYPPPPAPEQPTLNPQTSPPQPGHRGTENGRPENNVSGPTTSASVHREVDGVGTLQAPSLPVSRAPVASDFQNPKSVQFDLHSQASTDTETDYSRPDSPSSRRRRRHRQRDDYTDFNNNPNPSRRKQRRHSDPIDYAPKPKSKRRGRDSSPTGSASSDDTVELPPRFDQDGRKKPEADEDDLAEHLQGLLSGRTNIRDGLPFIVRNILH